MDWSTEKQVYSLEPYKRNRRQLICARSTVVYSMPWHCIGLWEGVGSYHL